jgi:hypothetical protein
MKAFSLRPRLVPLAAPARSLARQAHEDGKGSWCYSPTDLLNFLDSPFTAWMDRLEREDPLHEWVSCQDRLRDPLLEVLAEKG